MLFVPDHTTSKGSHIRDGVDLKRTMITVIIALIPALFYGMYNTGYQYFIQTGLELYIFRCFSSWSLQDFPMIASFICGWFSN
jgi:Na+-transporting NADH:ubiquinone oxidoreductase subunit B